MKKENIIKETKTSDIVVLAAAVGALSACAVIGTYKFLQTEKGKALTAKTKNGAAKVAGKVKKGANKVAAKVMPKCCKKETVAEIDAPIDAEPVVTGDFLTVEAVD